MKYLYYGDNLEVLKRHIKDASVDLVYLDPPFKSNRDYNVLFKEKDGSEAESQIKAFTDTWSWNQDDILLYDSLTIDPAVPERLRNTLKAMYTLLGGSDMMAYLVMMAPRLLELLRVMKPNASIYLHCDCSASHYLKLLMDAVFSPVNFGNEIIWKRAETVKNNFGQGKKTFDVNMDTLLFYRKSENNTFNPPFKPYTDKYINDFYKFTEPDTKRKYRLISMIGPGGAAKGNPSYEVMGVTRYWRYSREKMQTLIDAGMVVQTSENGVPQRKQYLDEGKGVVLQTLWDDIPALHAQDKERLGYPTQKPVALLERIIETSSNPGDMVLDPFCGCGTSVYAAEKTGRNWIGIDITQLSIALMKGRLNNAFGLTPLTKERKGADTAKTYRVKGEPTTLTEAMKLKEDDPYQFEYWALGLVGARPTEEKKGADKGIDGKLFFVGDNPKELETIIISVKSGHVKRGYMHELRGVIDREKAVIGVLITMETPTKNMMEEVLLGGFYESKTWDKKYGRLQILSIEDIMTGKGIDMPPINQVNATFIKAHKEHGKGDSDKQTELF